MFVRQRSAFTIIPRSMCDERVVIFNPYANVLKSYQARNNPRLVSLRFHALFGMFIAEFSVLLQEL